LGEPFVSAETYEFWTWAMMSMPACSFLLTIIADVIEKQPISRDVRIIRPGQGGICFPYKELTIGKRFWKILGLSTPAKLETHFTKSASTV